MIERVFIKDNLTIRQAEIELGEGLMVFSGSSGAGKSILMQAILSVFGLGEPTAAAAEVSLRNFDLPDDFEPDDEVVIKQVKKEKVRYFLNGQTIGKSRLKELGLGYLFHLNHKNMSEFDHANLIALLDRVAADADAMYPARFKAFGEQYGDYRVKSRMLAELNEQEKRIEELKDFARFEISRIDEVNPKPGEDEELMRIKKLLSKKDKIEDATAKAEEIFAYEHAVNELFELLGEDAGIFSDAMNEVRGIVENARDSAGELEEVDIEAVLDRIERIAELVKRYGSIEEALAQRDAKRKELEKYDDLESDKKGLEKELEALQKSIASQAAELSKIRARHAKTLEAALNEYLAMLYMPKATLSLASHPMDVTGTDAVVLRSGSTDIENLSAGEFNRMRLALLAAKVKFNVASNTRVLFLDEIDANLSGEESASVATVLKFLSERFQIFAISHQAQLTSKADKHFLVSKQESQTQIRELTPEERVREIARIVSGEEITPEALEYAKRLF
jgi:DNA repair protein RecN (Recombination protein N)